MNEEILIPLSFFAAVFGIAYLYFITRNKERMALIEKGASYNKYFFSFNSLKYERNSHHNFRYDFRKYIFINMEL